MPKWIARRKKMCISSIVVVVVVVDDAACDWETEWAQNSFGCSSLFCDSKMMSRVERQRQQHQKITIICCWPCSYEALITFASSSNTNELNCESLWSKNPFLDWKQQQQQQQKPNAFTKEEKNSRSIWKTLRFWTTDITNNGVLFVVAITMVDGGGPWSRPSSLRCMNILLYR